MSLKKELSHQRLYLDGGLGTLLQARGLAPGELPEAWNLSHPDEITQIHKSYYDAGSHIVCSNTFGIHTLKYTEAEADRLIEAALSHARKAASLSSAPQSKYVAFDIGPLGRLLRPYGDLDFEDAVAIFAQTVRAGVRHGADLILIETMNDSYETKAAVLAAKENSDLPIWVSNAYGEDGKLMTGTSPDAMAVMLEALGVDAIGANCSLGPAQLLPVARQLLSYTSLPVFIKPNAGLPVQRDGKTEYGITPDAFAEEMKQIALAGVNILGGCCGTTPEFLQKTVDATRTLPYVPPRQQTKTYVSSYTHCVEIGRVPVIIGERINPTGKKRFKQALMEGDLPYILKEGLREQECGAHILDVNVGLPGLSEKEMLTAVVCELQAVSNLPLQIDTSDPYALESALRRYNGKAMINSVNGKEESMRAVFPLAKKYGGTVVALTLDENGIPSTAEGRIAIAEKILRRSAEYGIAPKDLVFDTLCLAVSADTAAPRQTLAALRHIHEVMGLSTVLGVSNISFGLPARETVSAAFLLLALENGLSAAILNPCSLEMMKAYRSYLLLHGFDENCKDYLSFASSLPCPSPSAPGAPAPEAETAQAPGETDPLYHAIVKGLKESAATLCREALASQEPLAIVDQRIIPALDTVGRGFEQKTLYLPQLLMSAEAAKSAFEVIKAAMLRTNARTPRKARFVLATVKGDIHDIGKNIVRVLLENYGYQVLDLGKDVAPEAIVEAVVREKAPFCGLSALMTTTVPAMEETIRQLREKAPDCKIVVGGAVMTAEYAKRIGADKYAKDAMETVRYVESVCGDR